MRILTMTFTVITLACWGGAVCAEPKASAVKPVTVEKVLMPIRSPMEKPTGSTFSSAAESRSRFKSRQRKLQS